MRMIKGNLSFASDISHGDNNQYLMYPKYAKLNTTEDKTVGNIFTTMWVNFARSG